MMIVLAIIGLMILGFLWPLIRTVGAIIILALFVQMIMEPNTLAVNTVVPGSGRETINQILNSQNQCSNASEMVGSMTRLLEGLKAYDGNEAVDLARRAKDKLWWYNRECNST